MNEEHCCGTCKYHQIEDNFLGGDDWMCINDQSEYYTDWTDYNHCCDEWEER